MWRFGSVDGCGGLVVLTLFPISVYACVCVCTCSRGAYQDQEEDQALSGLAAAMTLKSRGDTFKVSLTLLLTCT